MEDDRSSESTATTVADASKPRPTKRRAAAIPSLPERFEARGLLGRGGMGVVVEAHDRSLDRDVALKVLPEERWEDDTHRLRFMREARAAATLRHPGIVTVYDVDADARFIVMELIRGESLAERLGRVDKLPPGEVRRIGIALANALGAAHAADVIHRDVKPSNILFDSDGEIRLADFGIASFGDSDLTSTGTQIGTPAYMSPEQLRARTVDNRADIYSAGASLYEAATGLKLHTDDGRAPDPERDVAVATGDRALARAIDRAVRERPADRFQSASDFASALQVDARAATHHGLRWAVLAALALAGVAIALPLWKFGGVRDDRSSARSVAAPTIALLPWTVHGGAQSLEFAKTGIPHMLGRALRDVNELGVVGYYDVLDSVPPDSTDPKDWASAAQSLGAGLLVSGELSPHGRIVELSLTVARPDGEVVFRKMESIGVSELPGTVQMLAGFIARHVLGDNVDLPAGIPTTVDVQRELALGIEAAERHDFPPARGHLGAVLRQEPENEDAHYYRAIAAWWSSGTGGIPQVKEAITFVREPARKGMLEGILRITNNDFPRGLEEFRALADAFPNNRDILYGLSEALYHGGYPADGIAMYRRVVDMSPRFRLGFVHPLDYYTAAGDESGMSWLESRVDSYADHGQLWRVRIEFARRDYAAAARLIDQTSSGPESRMLRRLLLERVKLAAVTRGPAYAIALASSSLDDARVRQVALWGLHSAAGNTSAARRARGMAIGSAGTADRPRQRAMGLIAISSMAATDGDPEGARFLLATLDSEAPGYMKSGVGFAASRVLIGVAIDDAELVAEGRGSPYPQIRAYVDAHRAERDERWADAATAWQRATDAGGHGKFRIAERLFRARALHRAGSHAEVIATCEDVLEPHAFNWSWGSAIGPCLLWSAGARRALGDRDAARRLYERLETMRSDAPTGDALLDAARAALASLEAE